VHSIDAHSWNPGTAGLFLISLTCDSGRRETACAAVERELSRRAAEGFSARLIAKAVRQAVVGEINTRKTMSGQASRLGVAEVVVGDLDYSRTYFQRLRSLVPSDLSRVVRNHLATDRLTVVSMNPAAAKRAEPRAASARSGNAAGGFKATTLKNGARLLLQSDRHLPNLHLRLMFLGGPMHESAGRRGATELLATLLTKDTKRRSAAVVARTIEEVGGSFYPFAGNNSFGLAVEVLPSDLSRGLELLADGVLAPAFKKSAFAVERDAQLASLQEDADDVVTFAQKRLRRLFFGGHPFGIDVHGDAESLNALVPADLAALHRRLAVAGNAVLAVAGDFDFRSIKRQLEGVLARLPAGAPPSADRGFIGPAAVGEFVETQPRQQAVVMQAFAAPGLLASDYYASEVADELFSGMSSRLFERVREEKGLAYFVRSARVVGLDSAMFYFIAGTEPRHAGEVLTEIDREVLRVAQGGVEEQELRRCQIRLKAARRMGLQTNAARAMQAGLNALYGLPVEDWKNYDAHVDAVDGAALQRFALSYLRKTRCTQLVVRP
jgi:zinc protease